MSGALFVFTCIVLVRTIIDGTTVPDTFIFPEWWIYAFAPTTFLFLMIIFIQWAVSPPDLKDSSNAKLDSKFHPRDELKKVLEELVSLRDLLRTSPD